MIRVHLHYHGPSVTLFMVHDINIVRCFSVLCFKVHQNHDEDDGCPDHDNDVSQNSGNFPCFDAQKLNVLFGLKFIRVPWHVHTYVCTES